MTDKKRITVADLVAYLQTLPQEYDVWSNTGYYDYEDFAVESADSVVFDIDHGLRRVKFVNN